MASAAVAYSTSRCLLQALAAKNQLVVGGLPQASTGAHSNRQVDKL